MAAVGRYVWVSDDLTDLEIKDGPFLWDPDTIITIPDGQHAVEESEAINAGYHYYVAPPGPIDILNEIIANIPTVNASYLADEPLSAAAVATWVHELARAVTSLARVQSGMTDDTSGTWWPVSAIESSGTQTATVGTEHVLASPTTLKTRVLSVDVSALSGAETVSLRIKGPVLSGGTQQVILGPVTFPAGLGSPFVQLPAILQTQGGDITLQQTGGTGRAFPWAIATID